MSDNHWHSDNSSHRDSFSPRDGFYDGTADDAHDLFRDDDSPAPLRLSGQGGRGGRADLSGAPGWVKAFVYLGALLAVAGMAVIFVNVLGTPEPISRDLQPGFPSTQGPSLQLSPDVKLGIGLFIAGFVLSVIGGIGHSASSRR